MKDAVIVTALSVLPRKSAARAMGAFARTGLSRLVVRAFVRAYGVDMGEAEHPLAAYPTLEALFVRRLRDGARPVDGSPPAMVSPVDGTVAFAGSSAGGRIEVAPGRSLDLAALVGVPLDGERDAIVIYLSPTDYHRVHVPREGSAVAWRYVPGTLWPVFPAAVRRVDGLFSKNERMVVDLDTEGGVVHVALVGAFGVGRIETVLSEVQSNTAAPPRHIHLDPAVPLARGADLGVFHLGSTVVIVAEPGRWAIEIEAGARVRVGGRIAKLR